jgi:hypothetical protein
MIRRAAVVAVFVCLSQSWLYAQGPTMTVNAASADVYKSPSTGSPVIGRAPRGAVLQVTRELGSWVKVPWPDAQDGVGYIHVSAGLIARGSTPAAYRAAGGTSIRPAPESAASAATSVQAQVERTAAGIQPAPMRPVFVTPATHVVGLGGRIGGPSSKLGFGAGARAWRRNRLGLQLEVSRYALISSATPGRLTSIEFEPSFLYSLPDRVGDYLWLRPYVGSGVSLRRQTFNPGTRGTGVSTSDRGLGLKAFGGAEMTFASVPQFALSADVGYKHLRTPVAGFDLGGLGVSVSGHWYVK